MSRNSFGYINENERNRIRRNIKLRKYRKLKLIKRFSILFICLVLCGIIFGSTESIAGQTHEKEPVYKYYKSICISEGDTLTSITNLHFTAEFKSKKKFMDEVRFINHLDTDDLAEGGYLVIPYYSIEIK